MTASIAAALAISAVPALAQSKAPRGKQPSTAAKAAATPPAPAAAMPQVSAIGLRITGLGLGANGSELKPFNESPGTNLVLGVKAPKGSGIVAVDDDTSKIDAFSDDKGQSLLEEARVGSFPKVAEDGSAAMVEIEVRARPSAGAASLTAQGTLAMMLSPGSKPVRAANVKLEAAQTFKMGTTTLTISDPKSEEESTRFTVNLPRSLLTNIRQIRFFDAKNAPVEAERHGSGYFNEKAELELEAKTKDKTITIEFELWQNPKVTKVPFNVQVGLGVAAGGRTSDSTDAPPSGKPSSDGAGDKPQAAPAKPAGPPPTISAGEGAESVDAVVKQLQTAALAAKGAQVLSVIYPTERGDYAQGVAMALAFLPMASMDDQKAAEAMTKELDAFFAKHNLKPPFSKEPDELFKGVDMNLFVSDAFSFIKAHAKKGDKPGDMLPVPQGKPENVKVSGDSATATLSGKDVNFAKISGRWFIRLK